MSEHNSLTKQDVALAYQLTLGRPPESDDVINVQIKKHKTLRDLMDAILSGPEFYRSNMRAIQRSVIGKAPPSRVSNIDVDCDQYDLTRLFGHVQSVWSKLGAEQPHYSVLSAKNFLPHSIGANQSAFNESGRVEVRLFLERLAGLGLQVNFKGVAIELGCGVGRVTKFLADNFNETFGYDVSKPHLDLARAYLSENPNLNCDFSQIESLEHISFPSHDFFYSRIVLQHNPPPVISYLLNTILSKTKPGGVVYFQVPTSIAGYEFNVKNYLKTCDAIDDQELHVIPQAHVFSIMADNGIVPVEVYRDGSLSGFDRVSTAFIGHKPKI